MLHTIFFDLDNTLYSKDCGIWQAISARIDLYIRDILNIDEDKVQAVRAYCRQYYSTSLRGLQSLYKIDESEYLAFVHDVDLSKMLSTDYRLPDTLDSIEQRKIIFTNSDRIHANKVLCALHVQQYFDLVVDIYSTEPFVKPQEEAFNKALKLAGLNSPDGCVFIDDMVENVEQAHDLGFLSILIGEKDGQYLTISNIFDLPDLILSMNKLR